VSWLVGVAPDTEMAARVRAFDWSTTSLGPMEDWSLGLRNAVRTSLASDFGMLVLWGPDLVKIYNDRYRLLLGTEKHPAALGRPVRDVWPEIWDEIGPMLDAVMTTEQPTFHEHARLVVERNGFPEEAFFTWSYSPLYDDDGSIGGVLDVVVETTEEVQAQRRLGTLTSLSGELLQAESVTDACAAAPRGLARWSTDIRAVDVYLRVGDELPLVASNRRTQAAPLPGAVLREAAERDGQVVIGQLVDRHGPAAHVVVPIGRGEEGARGVMVLSLAPEVPLDQDFRHFIDIVSSTVGTAVDSAARRDRELGEHRAINETLQAAMITPIAEVGTVAARYVPAVGGLSVGGDWYDLVELDDNRRGLIVGDCVGHGLEAATAMGQLRSAARAMLLEGRDPASVLDGLDLFAGSVEGAFCATVVCALIDRDTRTITYSRAGHPPPLVTGPGGRQWLDGAVSLPLAVRPGAARTNATARMQREDVVVLYSDGLVERRGEPLDLGLERLAVAVEAAIEQPVSDLADRVLLDMLADGSRDDVVLVVKRLHT